LGAGSSGEVYKAFDPLINRPVAIKLLRLDVLESAPVRSFIERFYHEARIVGTLSHAHIITLFDAGQTEGQLPFLAFEYADGPTVMERLGTGESFSAEETLHFLTQIAGAVDYAHRLGVIHRDVKPSNLIIHRGQNIKITDFGIAKLVQAEPASGPEPTLSGGIHWTQGGSLLGTPSYMSPEQAQGLPLDGRSDLFSLAVVAFEMLTGELPFGGGSITATLYRVVHDEPQHPENLERRGFHPDRWHAVFSRALSKDPAVRFSTATELVDAIRSLPSSGPRVTVTPITRLVSLGSATDPQAPTTTLPFARASAAQTPATVEDPGTVPQASPAVRGRARASALVGGAVLLTAGFGIWLRPPPPMHPEPVELLVPEPPGFEVMASAAAPIPPERPRPTPAVRTRPRRNAPPPTPLAAARPVVAEPRSGPVSSKLEPTAAASGFDVPPRRREGREVRYPETARKGGVVGRVEVSYLVTENGQVRDVVVEVSTGSALDQEVVDAVRSWKFEPARRNGLPVPVRQRYRHEFRTSS
jgi:serine/threonine-protein kinase